MKDVLAELVRAAPTPAHGRNLAREYLQARTLGGLQRAGAMIPLAFHGGTALRFLYATPRYSEDLDFALERARGQHDLRAYLEVIQSDLQSEGYAMEIDFRQSNGEAELVDWIQEARGKVQGIIINGGAYTHTSIAILDALKLVDVPIIEVHLSNIFQREAFRRESYISSAAQGLIAGFGGTGYLLALDAMNQLIQPENQD